MARKRDYKAEYERRLERGRKKGLSRSQARGHPKKGEPLASSPQVKPKSDEKIEAALRHMQLGMSMTTAARTEQLSSKRLSQFIHAHGIAKWQNRKWIMKDSRPRRVPHIKGSYATTVTVPDFANASRAGQYHNAVGRFVNTGDLSFIEPFEGDSIIDTKGRSHPFETDPNNLFRYAMKDEPPFHEIYQIVSN
ncbi:hypothetical protein [Hirschia litorea]|uniref:Uncharacterized protein n=1 Tax=Hirschia litorea TaxID=1199156 RepID=A0ABW2IJ81_9PROT